MVPQWIIEKKRDGGVLSTDEIQSFISGYTRGEIPDYQMAALAMAIYFRGMTFDETAALTDAMMRSGDVLDTSSIPNPTVDKHSTGGVGDKVSLILAPLVACCGVAVPMLSGRGLGITGGTLDKLESIPGYNTRLTPDAFLEVVRKCGCSIMGQTENLAPADRKLYALRDVTATVPSIPLISASIMSKKLAEGASGLVLDVKWGRGAFMKTRKEARTLATTMVEIGARMGRRMTALLTCMDQPLGDTAGNALEIEETVRCLKGKGESGLMKVTMELSAHMLVLAGRASDLKDATAQLRKQLLSGAAFERFRLMVSLHGGDVSVVNDPTSLPRAKVTRPFPANQGGYLSQVDADAIGRACLALGAGRRRVEDAIDHAVGVSGIRKVGEHVQQGQPLLALHGNDESRVREAEKLLESAFQYSPEPVRRTKLIGEVIQPGERQPK